MDPVSIFTIVTGVVGLLSTGAKGVMKWKEHRKEKKAKQLAKAEEALMEGQVVLKRDYDRHHGFFGSLFDKGDSISLWSLNRTMQKFKRTMGLFMEFQTDLTMFEAAIRAARTESSSAMDQLYQRLRTSRAIPQSLRGARNTRALGQSADSDDGEGEDDDNGNDDRWENRLVVSHPEPEPSRSASSNTTTSTSSSLTAKSYVRMRPSSAPPASVPSPTPVTPAPVPYRNSINLQKDLESIGKGPIAPIRSSVCTTLSLLTPQVTITTLEVALDSLDSEVITPITVTTCPGSPRVLEENFKLLFGEQPSSGSSTPEAPAAPHDIF